MVNKRVLIPLADEFDEISLASFMTILSRAGVEITLAGIPGKIITSGSGMTIVAEKKVEDINPEAFDGIVLIAGNSYKSLIQSSKIREIIKKFDSEKKLIVAVSESPAILSKAGLLEDKLATISHGMERVLSKPRDKNVIIESNIITARAPIDSMDAALKMAECLISKDVANEIKAEINGNI